MANRIDPFAAFIYVVEFTPDIRAAGFSEVSGLDAEVQAIDYRNGDDFPLVAKKLQGLQKYPNLVFKRGIIGDLEMYKWLLEGINGKIRRREGSVVLLDELRKPIMRWSFRNGWACKYTGPSLKGDSNAVAIESLEITHEGLRVSLGANA